MAENYEPVNGLAFVRGDGTGYFIPEADLEVFRLPEEEAAALRGKLEEDEVTGYGRLGIEPGDNFLFGSLAQRPSIEPGLLGGSVKASETPTKVG